MSQLRGKLRQKVKNGPYYYRLMVAKGLRKEFSLKTCDYEEACQKAADLDAVGEAPTKEVAIRYTLSRNCTVLFCKLHRDFIRTVFKFKKHVVHNFAVQHDF